MDQEEMLRQQKEQCIFCKIVANKMPSKKVFEDDKIVSTLDINPATKGHMLIIPKEHYQMLPMVPLDEFSHLFRTTKKLSKCLQKAFLAQGTTTFIASGGVAGQQAYHFMFHLMPRDKGDGLSNFDLPQKELPESELEQLKPAVSQNITGKMMQYLKAAGKPMPQGVTGSNVPKEQIMQIIEQNPQIKEMILKQPEQFKQMIPQNPQLQQIFGGVDIDELHKELSGGGGATPIKADLNDLADALDDNPELKEVLKTDVERFRQLVSDDEDLKKIFSAVDLNALSELLKKRDK